MEYILDRFEETFAILEAEDRSIMQIRKDQLPATAAEGSVLICKNGIWQVLAAEATKARIRAKMDSLWET